MMNSAPLAKTQEREERKNFPPTQHGSQTGGRNNSSTPSAAGERLAGRSTGHSRNDNNEMIDDANANQKRNCMQANITRMGALPSFVFVSSNKSSDIEAHPDVHPFVLTAATDFARLSRITV